MNKNAENMNATLFLATTVDGLARAEKQPDASWQITHPLPGEDARSLAFDPHQPDVVLCGTQGNGLFRSDDKGKTWQPAGLRGQIVKSIAFDNNSPNIIYAGLKPPMVWKSVDYGATWEEMLGFQDIPSLSSWSSPAEPPGTAYVHDMAVSPTNPNIVIAGIEFGAVVRSIDAGETWSDHRIDAIEDCHTLIFHHSNGMIAYEGGGTGGGAISEDRGNTWFQPTKGLERRYGWAVAADPEDPLTWYLSAAHGPNRAHGRGNADARLYRTVDGGRWQDLTVNGLPTEQIAYALLTDVHTAGHLYAVLSNGDVWFSSDYGDSWQQLPFNFGARVRYRVVMS